MDHFTELLKHYVEQNPPASGDAQAVVHQLFWAYIESNRMDYEKLNRLYEDLRRRIDLPPREYDQVLYTISDMNLEYGKHAFTEGLKVALVLFHEFFT